MDGSPDSSGINEDIGRYLDSGIEPRAFDAIIELVEDSSAQDVEQAWEEAVEENRDRLELLPPLLDHVDSERYLSEGTEGQRACLATIQCMVAKHTPNRREDLIPVLVDGIADPVRRDRVADTLKEICQYRMSTARATIEELENVPESLYSDPGAVDAITGIVNAIENHYHRFRGKVELPAIARLQVSAERDAAKRELVERLEQSDAEAKAIVESIDQLLETVGREGRENRLTRQKAREILFEAAIAKPEILIPYGERLVDASGVKKDTVANSYARILHIDANAARDLFASIISDAAQQQEFDHRVEAIAGLLPGAPDHIVTAIQENVPADALDSPPIDTETQSQVNDSTLDLLALLWTDSTASIGKQLIARELENGRIGLASDLATVIRNSHHSLLAEGISQALHSVDDPSDAISREIAEGIRQYLHCDNASGEIAAMLAAPLPEIGEGVIELALSELEDTESGPTIEGQKFYEFIDTVRAEDPAVVAAQVAPLIEHATTSPMQSEFLSSIGDALEREPVAAVNDERTALNLAVGLLSHEDDEIVIHGCRLIAHLEPYPAPEALLNLAEDSYGEIERRAEWAVGYIEESSPQIEADLLDVRDRRKPAITHLTKQNVVKYRSEDVWKSLRLGPLEMDILNTLATYYDRNQSVAITHPAHNPQITLLYAVSLLCEGAQNLEAPTVGIVSPVYWHERWGTFGDIEAEYRKYGLYDDEGTTIRAVSFEDLFGTGKVKGDKLASDRRGQQSGTLILTKSIDSLRPVTDELTAIVVQAIERITIPFPMLAQQISEDFEDTPVFPIYSSTTKQDTGGAAAISPPVNVDEAAIDVASTAVSLEKIGVKLPNVAAVRNVARSIGGGNRKGGINHLSPPIRGALQAAGYTWSKEITVRAVGIDRLRDSLNEALDIGFDLDDGGSLILGTAFRFERLPVHASDFDEWVESQDTLDPRSRVESFPDQLDGIEESTDRDHISSTTTIAVREGVRALDTVYDEVSTDNPIFDRLQTRLEETIEKTQQVGVVVASNSFADALRDVLADEVDASIGEDVVVLKPEDVSSMLALDRLFVIGPPRPAHAAICFPSCTSQVEILTVGDFWDAYIEKHASRYREELVQGLGVDGECLGDLSIETIDETTEVEKPAGRPRPATSETADGSAPDKPAETEIAPSAVGGGGNAGSAVWMPDSLTEAFERAAEAEADDGVGEGGFGSKPTYEIRTEADEVVELGRGEAIYLIEDRPSGEPAYSWTSPSNVEAGDEILVIDPAFFQPRRDQWLKRQYEQQFDDPEAVFQGLYQWWTAMSEILQQLDESVGPRGSALQEFYDAVTATGVSKHKQTVRLWIKAIEESAAPIELATVSDGTKGPDRAEDIEAIGRAFDRDQLEEDAEAIEAALVDVREFNALGGLRYRKIIESRLEEGSPAFREAATPYTVVEVRKLDEGD